MSFLGYLALSIFLVFSVLHAVAQLLKPRTGEEVYRLNRELPPSLKRRLADLSRETGIHLTLICSDIVKRSARRGISTTDSAEAFLNRLSKMYAEEDAETDRYRKSVLEMCFHGRNIAGLIEGEKLSGSLQNELKNLNQCALEVKNIVEALSDGRSLVPEDLVNAEASRRTASSEAVLSVVTGVIDDAAFILDKWSSGSYDEASGRAQDMLSKLDSLFSPL